MFILLNNIQIRVRAYIFSLQTGLIKLLFLLFFRTTFFLVLLLIMTLDLALDLLFVPAQRVPAKGLKPFNELVTLPGQLVAKQNRSSFWTTLSFFSR